MENTYHLNGTSVDPATEAGQRALGVAHMMGHRPMCRCTHPNPEMYIARVNDIYIVKRMPSSGTDHAPQCDAFQPPEELSGLSQIQGSAFDEDPEDGTTRLKLGFSLAINGKSNRPAPPAAGEPTEAKSPERKLTLTSLLHYLWHEADLVKWTPRMEGKRWWGVIQRELLAAAGNKIAKRQGLATRLFIPDPFKVDEKTQIAARRSAFFHTLTGQNKSATALGILIAEYKGMELTRLGARFTFKHMPDCKFFADQDLVKKFQTVFESQMMIADMVPDSHVMVIATFRIAPAGYPALVDIGLMLTTSNWIPFEHLRDVELLDAMTRAKRAFIKSMRFNLPETTPIASMMATDTTPPTAMFITAPNADDGAQNAMRLSASEGTYQSWLWGRDQGMPELPGS